MAKEKVVAACDIGSSKVVTLIGKIDQEENFSVIGIGKDNSNGIRKGVVVNIEATTQSIKKATNLAEVMSAYEVDSLIVNVGGEHISGINSKGVVAVSGKNNEINEYDVARVIEQARTIVIPTGREIIHVLEQEFIVDNQDGIKEPIGMSGVRLEASVHLITGSSVVLKNLKNAIIRANYRPLDIIISPLAASEAVLSPDEKELGVMLIDIGDQTTDVICFYNQAVYFTNVISMGSFNITKDIAILLKIPVKEAERIKLRSGYAYSKDIPEDEKIEIPPIGANPSKLVDRKLVSMIIEERLKELFSKILKLIEENNLKEFISSGIVLTGGGVNIGGIEKLSTEFLKFPVRIGKPENFKSIDNSIFSPEYSVVVGLLKLYLEGNEESSDRYDSGGFFSKLKKIFGF